MRGGAAFLLFGGKTFQQSPLTDWGSLLVLGEAVCLFSCLSQCDGSHTPALIRRCVGWVARLSLPMYLLSYIPDTLLYPLLNGAVPEVGLRILWMPFVVLLAAVSSFLLALPVGGAVRVLNKLLPADRGTG